MIPKGTVPDPRELTWRGFEAEGGVWQKSDEPFYRQFFHAQAGTMIPLTKWPSVFDIDPEEQPDHGEMGLFIVNSIPVIRRLFIEEDGLIRLEPVGALGEKARFPKSEVICIGRVVCLSEIFPVT